MIGAPQLRWLRHHERVAAALVYALVLVGTYHNVVFLGDSLVSSNSLNILEYRLTERTHGPNFRPASVWTDQNLLLTANLHDPGASVTQWEPGAEFLRRSLLAADPPFWDPYVGGGVPAMSNLTSAFFFPPSLIVVLLGNGALLKNVYFLGLLFTTGWCTWAFLRRSGLSWSASLVGGLAFMLSGGVNQTVGGLIGQTACCVSIALLATRWFLERATWTATCVLALVYAAIALSSFPPELSAVFGLSATYAAVELALGGEVLRSGRGITALRFGTACGLSLALVAWYYLPAFDVLAATPQVRIYYSDAASHTPMYASGLLQLFSPTLMGGVPNLLNDPIPRTTVAVFNYVGATALLLVALVGWRDLRKPIGFFAAMSAIGIVGLMIGFGPFSHLRELPGLRNFHFALYYGVPLDFVIALLAAAGFARLQQGVTTLRTWLAVSLILAGMLTLLFVALGVGAAGHPAFPQWRGTYLQLMAIVLAAATVSFARVSLASRAAPVRARLEWALVAILVAEGILNAHVPRPNRWDVWDYPPPYIEYLQQHAGLGRVFTMGSALYANSGSALGIIQLDSLMMFNPPRIYDLYLRYVKTVLPLTLRDAREIPPDPVLDAAGISHVTIASDLTAQLADLKARGYERVYDDGLFRIFRRPPAPRYFFTSQYRVAKKRYAIAAVAERRPQREVVVESEPPFPSRPVEADVPVKVEQFSNNRVRLSLVAPHPGFVYMSESFFPGWTATVNGVDTPIQPANYAFRAVAIPAGAIDLRLQYFPPGLLPGLVVSSIALMIVAAVLGTSRRQAMGIQPAEPSSAAGN